MTASDLIKKKRDGGELTTEEIDFLVKGLTSGAIPDYQVTAWAMAVFFRGMSARETRDLALAMAASGDTVDLSGIRGIKVDKHSTGGVGDKTTLVVIPLVAAAGVPVAKMSGRGLGHTGGTVDKFESIPGFRSALSREEFIAQVNAVGAAVVAQSGNLVPADKKLYALRDVTATVDSIPLIASSVMSKKLAAGADAIVLDVKVGSGAFMKRTEEAFQLARLMVDIGTGAGRRVVALVTDMDQPLGHAVGNLLEVREAVDTLRGKGPADLEGLCLHLAGHMLALGGKAGDPVQGTALARQLLAAGDGLAKLREMVAAQGGRPEWLEREEEGRARYWETVPAPSTGYVAAIDAEAVGLAAMRLGAGREKVGDVIDPAVGVVLDRKLGDRVEAGEPLAHLAFNEPGRAEAARRAVAAAYRIEARPVQPGPLVLGTVTGEGTVRLCGEV